MIWSKSIKKIIIDHYRKYPEMEAIDYIKLIYQNVFGCGHHLVADKSYEFLILEYNQFTHDYKENTYIDIGNGYVRLDLTHTNLSVDEIHSRLKESAKCNHGTMQEFTKKINVLKSLCKSKTVPIQVEDIDKEINSIDGLPSHSEKYHHLYSPHYRVIKKSFITK